MGVLGLLVGLPLAPAHGVIALARVIAEQAEREAHDVPSTTRHLAEVEEAQRQGVISDEQAVQLQRDAVRRLLWRPSTDGRAAPR